MASDLATDLIGGTSADFVYVDTTISAAVSVSLKSAGGYSDRWG
jgi:hypothetical protein